MTYRVLALDPGGTTGWATYTAQRLRDPVEEKWEYYDEKFDCNEIGPEEHHQRLWTLLELQHTAEFTIVCESFEFRIHDNQRDNVELISREYIGITKLYTIQRPASLRMQTAAKAKGFIPDKGPQANVKLRQAGLWVPSHKPAMDAMRHLLYFLVNVQGRMDLVERWWKPV
jgi:hypothetical protein